MRTEAEQLAWEEGRDEGATFVFVELAKALGVLEWSIQDGTEEWDGDVRSTLYGILETSRAALAKANPAPEQEGGG